MRRRWLWVPLLAALIGTSSGAQTKVKTTESTALPDTEPGSERWVDYLSGGAWSSSKGGEGRSQPAPYQPTWLTDWTARWQLALQAMGAGREPLPHPLIKVSPMILGVLPAESVQPQAAAAASWRSLACPQGPAGKMQVQLHVQVLAETPTGQATLGLHWVCRSDDRQWLRQVRLVAEVDTLGRCTEAFGVLLEGPGQLEPRHDPTSMPQWPLQGAQLDSGKPAWALAGGRGWLVQVEKPSRVGWFSERGLPTLESEDPNLPAEMSAPQRQLWWLDRRGRPLAQLLSSALDSKQRPLPLPREAVLDLALSAAQGPFLLQRYAVFTPLGLPTRAGLWAWRLGERTAEAWSVELPALSAEGVWHCQPDPGEKQLHCQFHGAGAVPLQLDELALEAEPGQRRWRTQVKR
jgi:hypothetical protein